MRESREKLKGKRVGLERRKRVEGGAEKEKGREECKKERKREKLEEERRGKDKEDNEGRR